jgi:hypothetical protein
VSRKVAALGIERIARQEANEARGADRASPMRQALHPERALQDRATTAHGTTVARPEVRRACPINSRDVMILPGIASNTAVVLAHQTGAPPGTCQAVTDSAYTSTEIATAQP